DVQAPWIGRMTRFFQALGNLWNSASIEDTGRPRGGALGDGSSIPVDMHIISVTHHRNAGDGAARQLSRGSRLPPAWHHAGAAGVARTNRQRELIQIQIQMAFT
ncbi:MAG: hypothetical protein ABI767_05575, partial [Rhodanobacter sp.]